MPRYFMIRCKQTGKVMDLKGEVGDPGTQVMMWEGHGGDNQLWYKDGNTIRSKLCDLCLTIDDSNTLVVDEKQGGNQNQKWKIDGDMIRNPRTGQVLDVADMEDDSGARVCAWEEHGQINQLFEFEYV